MSMIVLKPIYVVADLGDQQIQLVAYDTDNQLTTLLAILNQNGARSVSYARGHTPTGHVWVHEFAGFTVYPQAR